MSELIRFRCTRCNTSLKVSGAKAGTRVACPKCGLELAIPDAPGAMEGARVESATRVDPGAGPTVRVEEAAELAAAGGGSSGFLNLDLRLDAPPTPAPAAVPKPAPPKPQSTPNSASTSTASGDGTVLRSERISLRSRDVVLPRTAAVAYSTFSILGLLFAFLTGLLIGHFLWK